MLFKKRSSYKDKVSLDKRIAESYRIKAKYPAHIPVIVEGSDNIGELEKPKFLVPSDVSASHLLHSVRKQIKTTKSDALFLFDGVSIICPTSLMGVLYDNHLRNRKDEEKGDLFFYITVATENTFGKN